MKVYAQLNEARRQFHTLQLKKTGLNKFAGYQYFELCDFLVPALNVFDKNGLCAYISFGKEMATMTIAATEDGSSILLTSPMAEANLKGCHPIQNLGAVETYTRRYLWVAALEIVEHDAIEGDQQSSDGNAAAARPAKKQSPVDYFLSINQAPNLDLLKSHFAAAWKMADAADKDALKAAYDKRNEQLTTKATA